VGVAGEDQRDAERRRLRQRRGSCASSTVIGARAARERGDVDLALGPEPDADEIDNLLSDRQPGARVPSASVRPLRISAAGMSWSSSWLPRMPNTPCGAARGASASAAGRT